MRSDFEDRFRLQSQRLADLREEAAELQRRLQDAQLSLEHDLDHAPPGSPAVRTRRTADFWADEDDGWPAAEDAAWDGPAADGTAWHGTSAGGSAWDGSAPDRTAWRSAPAGASVAGSRAVSAGSYGEQDFTGCYRVGSYAGDLDTLDDRTETLAVQGRRSEYSRGFSRRHKGAITTAAACAFITILVLMLSGRSPAWPASVARVTSQAATACQNPDVMSEPGQVNFACAKGTRQILWVFALLTSGNNPRFRDPKTGRVGLEPITPAQGGSLAWSLNLHHPFNPANPIDSLQVAARAINNIIGGATLTGPNGRQVVQPGLESYPANCRRYTGSAAMTSRSGFPSLCARPVTSRGGQAALVADVYRKWIVGASPGAAEDAAVLFANAKDPGNPRVQEILKRLRISHG